MAELADALDSGSSGRKVVEVQPLSSAYRFILIVLFAMALLPSPVCAGIADKKYPLEILFAPKGGVEAKLAEWVQNAESSIAIAAYNVFLPDVTLSLIGAKARGVDVRIVMDDFGPTVEKSDFPLFRRNGIGVIMLGGFSETGAMNHSFMVVDGKRLAIGSYRWSESGQNDDYSSMMFTEDPDAINTYKAKFEQLWAGG